MLHAPMPLKAIYTLSHSWQEKHVHVSPAKLCMRPNGAIGQPERPLTSISLSQTLTKLHLAT